MKRLFALMLAALLALSLCACGKDDAGTTGSSAPETTQAAPETTLPETTAPETTAASASSEVLGATVDGVYSNDFIGIGWAIDPAWGVASREELAELAGITADVISDETLSKALEESGVIYDLYAISSDGLTTVTLGLENLGVLYGAVLSEEAYVNLSKDNLVTALGSAGLTDVTAEAVTLTFAGAEHAGIQIHGLISGMDFYERLVCVKSGSYMAVLAVGTYQEDTTEAILSQFYALEN